MIKLWVSVSNQAYIFLSCVLGGMIIAFIYDIFRIRRKAVKASNIIVYLEDLIYWILVALVLFGVVYLSNEGEIRGYLLIGVILGIIIYIFLLSKIIMAIFMFIIGIIYRFAMIVFNILFFPIKILYKIFRVPLMFIFNILRKGTRKVRRMGKNRLDRLKNWKRAIKNIRKKI